MRILHLTDFHYKSNSHSVAEQARLVEALVKALSKEDPIDFLFFTGDLVFSGKEENHFNEAKPLLLDAVITAARVPNNNVFICAGNHDVYRNQELEDVKEAIQKVNSEDKLLEYINKQDGRSFRESLRNLEHYFSFQEAFYKQHGVPGSDKIEMLYSTHKRKHNETRIGIVTLNSAWRAIDSDTDRGNLLFPVSLIKQASEEVKPDTDFRILLMHHPTSDFKDWNASNIEDVIFVDFHSMFSGHIHKKKQLIQLGEEQGIFCCTSPATLTVDDSYIGYSIVDIDLSSYEIDIWNRKYERMNNSFFFAPEPIQTAIPVNQEKKEQNEFRKVLRKRYTDEVRRANELFISFNEHAAENEFLDLFTRPILKDKTRAQIAFQKSQVTSTPLENISVTGENVVIYGKDKSGKTSILYKVFLDLLRDFTIYKQLPIYIDCKQFLKSEKKLNLISLLSRYYEVNSKKMEEIVQRYPVRLLLDNFDINNSVLSEELNGFLKSNSNVFFTATSEDSFHTLFDGSSFGEKKYHKLFIHEIARSEVRSLANKWPNLTPEKRDLILDKIFNVFGQMNIPTNYWTVSLFIWIFEKNHDANFHNSFDLIQLYIDNLLDKQTLALDKKAKINFEDFKVYLSELAYDFLFNHNRSTYTASFADIVSFTEKYRAANKKFVIPVKEIVDLIIDKGILREQGEDKYTFRLNGVFEYFLAYYMHDNAKFRNEIIDDSHFYLSFANELELCSGFSKRDKEFVEKVFKKTQILIAQLFENYKGVDIDLLLTEKVKALFEFEKPMKQLQSVVTKAMSVEKQDEMLDELQQSDVTNSEVIQKEYYEKIDYNSDNVSKALFILSRVYRNSSLKDDAFNEEVFDFLLNSFCYMTFLFLQDASSSENFQELNEEEGKMLMQLMGNFIPIIIQVSMSEAIGQNNLERILLEKIEELKKNSNANQFKLTLLYFCLIDLDLKANKKYIEELISLINIPVLQFTIQLKLNVFKMFKVSGSTALEEYLQEQLRTLENKMKLEPTGNVRPIEKKGQGKFRFVEGHNKRGRKKK